MATMTTHGPLLGQHLFLSPELSLVDVSATVYTMVLWAMMIFLPNWEYTIKLLRTPFCLLPHLLLYTLSALPTYPSRLDLFIHPSINSTYSSVLLGTESLDLLVATHMLDLHLLTLNLFVGRWIFWEGRNNLPHVLLAACLFLTMFSGPAGLAFYLLAVKLREGMKL
jgi:hypothetical protein